MMIPAISIIPNSTFISTNLTVVSSASPPKPKPTLHETLKSLSRSGKLDDVIRLIEESPPSELSNPDVISTALHACISSRSLPHGQRIHSLLLQNPNFQKHPGLQSKLITLFSFCGRLDIARRIFDDVVSKNGHGSEQVWAAMAIGYSRNEFSREALVVYVNMLCHFVEPRNFAFSVALKACADLKDSRVGRGIHAQIVKSWEKGDQVVNNALLRLYKECGCFDDVVKVFDGMPQRNIVSWNSLISSLAEQDRVREMLDLFRKMQEEEIGFSWVTVTTILPICSRMASLYTGKEIHGQIVKSKGNPDLPLLNALLVMYGKCGAVDYARRMYDRMLSKDMTSWNTMLNGYAINGCMREAMDLFDLMIESGVKPDGVTFLALLSGCSDMGLIDHGQRLFDRMKGEFKISPGLEHYACLVDILGRAGNINEAINVVKNMPFNPNGSILGSLLNSCRLHGNVFIGEIIAKKLFEIEPDNPGNYVVLSNIYADMGEWENVDKIRELMKQKGIQKEVGCSWIQVKDRIRTFVSGGGFEFRNSEEYKRMCNQLAEAMEKNGYDPDTSVVLHDVDEETRANWVRGHSERLALIYGLIHTGEGMPIRITKNLRVCADCHSWMKIVSRITGRVIVLRDKNLFHHFNGGECSCKDYW